MRMGFDLDDVVFVSLSGLVNEGIKLGLLPAWVEPGDIKGRMETQFNISPEDMKRILTVDMFDRLNPMEDVVSDIRRWISEGDEIFFITARSEKTNPGIEEGTVRCLDRCGLMEGCAGLFHERSSLKWERARDLCLDSFVDDMPHVLKPMADVVPRVFLMATDSNRHIKDMRRWRWSEIRDELDEIRRSSCSQAEGLG